MQLAAFEDHAGRRSHEITATFDTLVERVDHALSSRSTAINARL